MVSLELCFNENKSQKGERMKTDAENQLKILTQQVLNFAKNGKPSPRLVVVFDNVMKSMIDIFESQLSEATDKDEIVSIARSIGVIMVLKQLLELAV